MVRLKQQKNRTIWHKPVGLNSTMVRLKRITLYKMMLLIKLKSQFHYGSIKTTKNIIILQSVKAVSIPLWFD